MTNHALKLKNRSAIKLTGPDAKNLLQGLITNDIKNLDSDNPLYAGLLSPQGKYLFDFIVTQHGDDIYLDCERERAPDLWRKLMMYKLRADAEITDESDSVNIWAIWGDEDITGIIYQDPRHWKIGRRAIVKKGHNLIIPDDGTHPCDPLKQGQYDIERITLGIPDGTRDIIADKNFWLECRAEALNGVNFHKGCYIGQEQTARMKHRATLKKSLVPVRIDGGAPEFGTEIQTSEGKKVGDIRSSEGDFAIAYIRVEYSDTPIFAESKAITVL